MSDWEELEVNIDEVKSLLNDYEVEVTSPDGWVPVSEFVDKGNFEEYILTTENGLKVRCNENHLFETEYGWEFARDLAGGPEKNFLTESGYALGIVEKTGDLIPIVDITVEHENHRYYTNGVSSHNTNVGKTLFLIHHAASCLSMGYNVAYFSMEMDEDELSKRIDASKLNIDINDLTDTPTQVLKDRFQKVCSSSWGKLKLKQFPTGQASVTDFEAYLNELKIQENFKPDIVYVDYIGITGSANLPQSAKQNSYLYFKSVAEELRAFGVENSFPVMTATQTNRDGYAHADPDMDKGSDSFGIFMTADFGGAILTNDELENLSQYLFKQLKNRYNQKMKNKRFLIGYDLTRMRLFDVTQGAQTSGLPNNGGGQTQGQPDTIQLNKKKRSNTLDFGKIKI